MALASYPAWVRGYDGLSLCFVNIVLIVESQVTPFIASSREDAWYTLFAHARNSSSRGQSTTDRQRQREGLNVL